MSRVFLAEEVSLGRKVVIKVLPPDLAATVNVERFRREILLAAKLQHPHIVPVLAAGISDGLPYYTMPYVEGESLRSRIARTGALPIDSAEKILAEVLSALEYAHEHGVIHRDIKPDNILLTGHHAVVTDFGVAKAISAATNPGPPITSAGVAIGTPAYMAPEQAMADPALDHRADLYAVGAVAYEMLTGHQIFSARSEQALLAAHAIETPEPVTKRRGTIPRALADTVMRSLEKNAADRPQSAAEMLGAIEAAMIPGGTKSKWSDRTGTLLAIGSAVVLLLLSSSSWYWYKNRRASADPPTADAIPSLAVLPFENLGKPEDTYFADGMTDAISTRLDVLSGLRLVGRQSARGYANSNKPVRQIGEELGVTYLLTGTVRWDRSKAGRNIVRVSPELLRASDGTRLWSEPTEGELTGVFDIQSSVAERVAHELRVRLQGSEIRRLLASPTQNLSAYDDYLRGRKEFSNNRYDLAAPFFSRAARADAKFALALAFLGRALTAAHWFGQDSAGSSGLVAGRKAIDSALALNPNLAEAHLALGAFYYHGQLDFEKALAEYAEAERLAPNNSDAIASKAYVERRQGKFEEAARDLRHATAIDPRDVGIQGGLADNLRILRQYDASDSVSRLVIALDSTWTRAYEYLANTALCRGDADSALTVLRLGVQKIEPVDVVGLLAAFVWPVMNDPQLFGRLQKLKAPDKGADRVSYYELKGEIARREEDPAQMRLAGDSIIFYVGAPRPPQSDPSQTPGNYGDLALAYAFKGEHDKAVVYYGAILASERAKSDAFFRMGSLVDFGYAASITGGNDEAIQAFRDALAVPNTISRAYLRADPALARLRRDPRFQQLIAGK